MNKHERAKETIVWNHHCFYHTINWLKISAAIQLGYFKNEMTQIILFACLRKSGIPLYIFVFTVFIHMVIDTFVWIKTPWFKLRCKIEIWSYKVMCLTLKRVKKISYRMYNTDNATYSSQIDYFHAYFKRRMSLMKV